MNFWRKVAKGGPGKPAAVVIGGLVLFPESQYFSDGDESSFLMPRYLQFGAAVCYSIEENILNRQRLEVRDERSRAQRVTLIFFYF